MLIKSIFVALVVVLGFIDEHTIQLQLKRPIIAGFLTGIVMGDMATGLKVGALVELMFIAQVAVGTSVPPDETMSAAIATAFAIAAGGNTEIAIATAIPVAVIGGLLATFHYSTLNLFFLHWGERCAAKGDLKGIMLANKCAMLLDFVLYGVPTFLAVYYGYDYVMPLVQSIPENVINALGTAGGMLGAVGFAMLAASISNKELWPFLLVGYFCVAFLGTSMIGVTVVAVAAALIYNIVTSYAKRA